MSKDLSHTELKIVALRNMASGILKELDEAEKKAAKPAPVNRNYKKIKRMVNIDLFYKKRNIS